MGLGGHALKQDARVEVIVIGEHCEGSCEGKPYTDGDMPRNTRICDPEDDRVLMAAFLYPLQYEACPGVAALPSRAQEIMRLPRRGSPRSASRSRTGWTADSLCQKSHAPERRAHVLEPIFVVYVGRNIRIFLAAHNTVPYDHVVNSLEKTRKSTCTVSMRYEVLGRCCETS